MSVELFAPPTSTAPRRRRIVHYPDGDGKPMAETAPHVSHVINVREILHYWFRKEESVCVEANMLLFYKKGFPKRRVAPDVFVAWDVAKKRRRSYKLWVEKQAPQVIFEITSRKTQEEDLGTKRVIYARIGVAEYYLFDPYGEYLHPPLRGYQLAGEEYVLRPVETLLPPAFDGKEANLPPGEASQGWRLISERLKLEIWALPTGATDMPYMLRFYDPAAREWLPDPEQAMVERKLFEGRAIEAERRQREAERRQHEAEGRQREAERRQHEAEGRQREAEGRRREAEARSAAETQSRQAAEAELAKLKAELEKLRSKNELNSTEQ
jgi:Uma2 family endonuclease